MNAKDLRLVRVLTSEQSEIFRDLITKYHSYVKSTTVGGRQLNYLVMADSVAVGCIGLGSLPMPTKPIIDYLEPFRYHLFGDTLSKGLGKQVSRVVQYNKFVANNWKFTLSPEAPENSGSRILGVLVRIAPKDWKEKYGEVVRFIVTYIGSKHTGAIYKASGWKYLGLTKGITVKGRTGGYYRNEGFTEVKTDRKLIFVKDLGTIVVEQTKAPKPEETQAVVVQTGSIPSVQEGDAVHNQPTAPLLKSKYEMKLIGGKYRIVKQ